ncbi:hypothetical protein [Rhodococcus sp. HNM0569]|uniref:hypothetical protein n=1 Tax=Rhodococcus sp. HNM0569 TaxID=2716340 RepID=UPI00146D69A0|nr:hypothetical protein [Rhodococcus sp. HNM0569]NLU84886.1 hypothetical protein [Rhodococcus sp. HNM0569]
MKVSIVTDDGFPAQIARELARSVPRALDGVDTLNGDAIEVEIESSRRPLPPTRHGKPALAEWYAAVGTGHDLTIIVSEIPHRRAGRTVLADVYRDRMLVLYTPAFGVVGARRRAREIAHHVLPALARGTMADLRAAPRHAGWEGPHLDADERHDADDADEGQRVDAPPGTYTLVSRTGLGRLRLLAGMVRSNRPWRLIPTLSGALGAASAASAFGIFYASIWQMASAMSVLRLALVTVVAVCAMALWLIVPNGLWERSGFRESSRDRAFYNAATVATVVTGVLCMYALLSAAVLAAAAMIVPTSFFEQQLREPATVVGYVKLAWLAASLGTVAGAVGSSTSDRSEILRATYGQRELDRRRAVEREQERQEDEGS